MPTRLERDQQRKITELERRLASVERDPGAAAEVSALEAAIAAKAADLAGAMGRLAASEEKSAARMRKVRDLQSEKKIIKAMLASAEKRARQAEASAEAAQRRADRADSLRRELAGKLALAADEIKALERERSGLIDVIASLRAQLDRSPENSSLPPSSDPNCKRIPNSRTRSGLRPGAQPGHAGHARRTLAPDAIEDVAPRESCPSCGHGMAPTGKARSHQVTDLVVTSRTVEYVSHERECPCCGRRAWDQFPAAAANEANYGPGVKSAIAYLTGACNVSSANARGFLRELSGGRIDVSGGSAHNFMRQLSARSADEIASIAERVSSSPVIGSDATFTRSGGRQSYIYVFHNGDDSVVFSAHDRKGHAALAPSPVAAARGAAVVHDHDTSYYSYGRRHAECNAHVLRYLRGVTDCEPGQSWASEVSSLLREANAAAKAARAAGRKSVDPEYAEKASGEYRAVLADAVAAYEAAGADRKGKYAPDGYRLAKRMLKYADNHLLFMHDLRVPFENNCSERLLRKAKGKLKQSGGFRSTANGEQPYCDLLTIVETAKMRGESPLKAIQTAFEA